MGVKDCSLHCDTTDGFQLKLTHEITCDCMTTTQMLNGVTIYSTEKGVA